jgi:UDP-N-acetylglucosamine transferase subunit ALG13
MILVTVGTSHLPFDRLLQALEPEAGETLVVQHGPSPVRPRAAECIAFMPHDVLLARMEAADAVVAHAGVGSILTAFLAGKRPIVVPRLRAYGEAVDDHQLFLGRRLAEEGAVELVEDLSELGSAIRRQVSAFTSPGIRADLLVRDLRSYLERQVERRRAR